MNRINTQDTKIENHIVYIFRIKHIFIKSFFMKIKEFSVELFVFFTVLNCILWIFIIHIYMENSPRIKRASACVRACACACGRTSMPACVGVWISQDEFGWSPGESYIKQNLRNILWKSLGSDPLLISSYPWLFLVPRSLASLISSVRCDPRLAEWSRTFFEHKGSIFVYCRA